MAKKSKRHPMTKSGARAYISDMKSKQAKQRAAHKKRAAARKKTGR